MTSAAEYQSIIASAGGKLVVVDFTATWCGPCKMIAPYFASLSNKYADVLFLKVDVDQLQDVSTSENVRSMPTFVFIKATRRVDVFSGADPNKLEQYILKHRPAEQPSFAGGGQRLGGASSGPADPLARFGAAPTASTAPAPQQSSPAPKPAAPLPPPAPVVNDDMEVEEEILKQAIAASLASTGTDSAKPATATPEGTSAAGATTTDGSAPAAPVTQSLPVSEELVKQLIDMGFPRVRAEKGLLSTGNKTAEAATEWIFAHMDDADIDEPWTVTGTSDDGKPKLSKAEVEARLEEVVKKARELKAKKEAQEDIEREKARRTGGKILVEEARKLEDAKMAKIAEERRREKEADRKHRDELRRQLEQDKLDRAAKYGKKDSDGQAASAPAPAAAAPAKPVGPPKEYTECTIQIKLADGSSIKQTFKPTDTLKAVYNAVAAARTDGVSKFQLVNVSAFPRKTITDAQLAITLKEAGLVPSGSLLVTN
eukprot:CAMPEP_0184652452 /NCGR_PEP_ID=MMETSP0308-20130426/10150_1 /TAXON_ID=38269 /ORGANISM="Gloeochaete witrockiana, Strain SAG 46.84" /LENGTH=484 /DNA_ID=CAMNT_0027087335 /DNA_START=141 /DNA_END=1595 /DNA_ORIENTATION=-